MNSSEDISSSNHIKISYVEENKNITIQPIITYQPENDNFYTKKHNNNNNGKQMPSNNNNKNNEVIIVGVETNYTILDKTSSKQTEYSKSPTFTKPNKKLEENTKDSGSSNKINKQQIYSKNLTAERKKIGNKNISPDKVTHNNEKPSTKNNNSKNYNYQTNTTNNIVITTNDPPTYFTETGVNKSYKPKSIDKLAKINLINRTRTKTNEKITGSNKNNPKKKSFNSQFTANVNINDISSIRREESLISLSNISLNKYSLNSQENSLNLNFGKASISKPIKNSKSYVQLLKEKQKQSKNFVVNTSKNNTSDASSPSKKETPSTKIQNNNKELEQDRLHATDKPIMNKIKGKQPNKILKIDLNDLEKEVNIIKNNTNKATANKETKILFDTKLTEDLFDDVMYEMENEKRFVSNDKSIETEMSNYRKKFEKENLNSLLLKKLTSLKKMKRNYNNNNSFENQLNDVNYNTVKDKSGELSVIRESLNREDSNALTNIKTRISKGKADTPKFQNKKGFELFDSVYENHKRNVDNSLEHDAFRLSFSNKEIHNNSNDKVDSNRISKKLVDGTISHTNRLDIFSFKDFSKKKDKVNIEHDKLEKQKY